MNCSSSDSASDISTFMDVVRLINSSALIYPFAHKANNMSLLSCGDEETIKW